MAAPTFVQTSTAQANTPASPYAPAYPAGLTIGNFLVLVANIVYTSGTGVVTPSGFTALTSFQYVGSNGRLQVFWRRIDGTEGANASIAFTGSVYPLIDFYEYSDVVAAPTSPLDQTPIISTETTGSATSHAAPAYTTDFDDSTLIDVIVSVGSVTYTPGRGTKRSDTAQTGGGQGTALADKPLASAGLEASANWTFGASTNSRVVSFALASGAGGGVTFVPQIAIL